MSFHDLHHQGVPFVLPNAWDVPSALAYLAEGFTAIGTTSFGVSSSGGHPDGTAPLAAPTSHWRPPWHRCNATSASTSRTDTATNPTPLLTTSHNCRQPESISRTVAPKSSSTPPWQPLKSLRSNNVTPRCSSTPASTPIGCASTPIPPARSSAHFATSMPAPTASLSHWPTIPTNLLSSLATFRARLTRCPCPA